MLPEIFYGDRCRKRYKGSQLKCTGSLMLMACIMLGCIVSYLAGYFDIPVVQAGKLAVRAAVLKCIQTWTTIYDPYNPLMAKLGPDDWTGWPPDALEPLDAINRLHAHRSQFGDYIKLIKAILYSVDDRAAVFAYQPETKELHSTRDRYNLHSVIAGKHSQIEILAALNDWTRRQWIHGTNGSVDFRRFDANTVIAAAKSGARFSCQVASMTFAQLAASIGYQARLISLSNNREDSYHAVSEVWIDDFDKWVVFDTDFNVYYTDGSGSPLNVLELHQALISGRFTGITVMKGSYRPEAFDIEEARSQPLLLPYYRYFYVDMRNDWMTNVYFQGHPKRSDRSSLRWQDEGEVGFLDLKPVAHDRSELYWPLNHVEVRLGVTGDKKVPADVIVYLKTITPNFDRFEVRIDNLPSFSHRSSRLTWKLRPGLNVWTVRAVNGFGVGGLPSRLEVLWSQF